MLQNILVIDDNEDVLLALKLLLKKYAKNIFIEKNPKKIPFLLNHQQYDVILLDMNFSEDITSGKEGFYWLEHILEQKPEANVVMITAFGEVEMAVKALKIGARDFVLKPWQNDKLVATIQNAAQPRQTEQAADNEAQGSPQTKKSKRPIGSELSSSDCIIGQSESMRNIFTIIKKVAATDANILILGENGTGKEVIAKAIHQQSLRNAKSFVSVDMGAITSTLFESELFGHKKGSFTDAKEDREGRFEAAHTGTLFLDEIGNLPLALQSKLLTALQQRKVVRVGSNQPISVDIRLVCATNMHLYDMVQNNEFRQDLLYRINTVELHLPALRERVEDIPILAEHFIKIYCQKYNQEEKTFSGQALKKMQEYHWPGNVRELQHAIERAVIMSDCDELAAGDFLFLLQKSEASELDITDFNLENVEKIVIQKALSKHGGNLSKAAKVLGLTRASLYRRLEKHGLQ
ncbi:MAG: sigma-54-dependent Fis family transcriptional regulator [Cytophagales bacterium]|nr:MAG: sigma-54-dependent Fis family transcriptional regulator [Cytophagales bacterium]TAF60944.1 MAG: sigma-54-dependent Fis family transcriptional regulator [Cytophagales bacterium]